MTTFQLIQLTAALTGVSICAFLHILPAEHATGIKRKIMTASMACSWIAAAACSIYTAKHHGSGVMMAGAGAAVVLSMFLENTAKQYHQHNMFCLAIVQGWVLCAIWFGVVANW